jgi:hypothetical protein
VQFIEKENNNLREQLEALEESLSAKRDLLSKAKVICLSCLGVGVGQFRYFLYFCVCVYVCVCVRLLGTG